jgi:hypothetical protein
VRRYTVLGFMRLSPPALCATPSSQPARAPVQWNGELRGHCEERHGGYAQVAIQQQAAQHKKRASALRIKIISMGAPGVGKSCLIKRYCEEKFVSKYIGTIGVDYGVKVSELHPHALSTPQLAAPNRQLPPSPCRATRPPSTGIHRGVTLADMSLALRRAGERQRAADC